jgi:hypothetical protein
VLSGRARFPSQDAGGVRRVSARFALTGDDTPIQARSLLDQWLDDEKRAALSADHCSLSHVKVEQSTLWVTIEAQAASRLWKGFLVQIVGRLAETGGVEFEYFYDEVARAPHRSGPAGNRDD